MKPAGAPTPLFFWAAALLCLSLGAAPARASSGQSNTIRDHMRRSNFAIYYSSSDGGGDGGSKFCFQLKADSPWPVSDDEGVLSCPATWQVPDRTKWPLQKLRCCSPDGYGVIKSLTIGERFGSLGVC